MPRVQREAQRGHIGAVAANYLLASGRNLQLEKWLSGLSSSRFRLAGVWLMASCLFGIFAGASMTADFSKVRSVWLPDLHAC